MQHIDPDAKTPKRVPANFRLRADIKALLQVAAERENRSLTNMAETMILTYCAAQSIDVDALALPSASRKDPS